MKGPYPTRLATVHAEKIKAKGLCRIKDKDKLRAEILRYAFAVIRKYKGWEDRHGISYVHHLADYAGYPYQIIADRDDVRAIRNETPYVQRIWVA